MLRLLLKSDRKSIKVEYRLRFLVMFFSVMSIVMISWIVFLLPSYLSISVEEKELKEKVDKIKETSVSKERTELNEKIVDLNAKLKILDKKDYSYKDLADAVNNSSGSGVSVELLEFTHNEEDKLLLSVRGVSSGRDSLLSFSNRLEEYEYFDKAEFPFSDFAKGSGIPFSIEIDISPL